MIFIIITTSIIINIFIINTINANIITIKINIIIFITIKIIIVNIIINIIIS